MSIAEPTPCLSFLRRELSRTRGPFAYGARCNLSDGHDGKHASLGWSVELTWTDEDADQCPAQSVEFNGMPIRCILATKHDDMHEDGCVRWEDPKPDSELMVAAKALVIATNDPPRWGADATDEELSAMDVRHDEALDLVDSLRRRVAIPSGIESSCAADVLIARLLVSGAVSEEQLKEVAQ